MLILAVIWIAYTAYNAVLLSIDHIKHKSTKPIEFVELLCDLCLGIHLLLIGLNLYDVLPYNAVIGIIPIALYVVGKIVIRKSK